MAVINFVELPGHRALEPLAEAVRRGLSSPGRSLPSRFFYDAIGSNLFEQIMGLPEYYLTRCETEILSRYAAEIIAEIGEDVTLIEFGSGNSAKTRLLIEAALSGPGKLHYVPIDISADCLRASTRDLAEAYGDLAITAFAAEYHDAMPLLPKHEAPRLFLFMGSNVGNFETREAAEFLTKIRNHMAPSDRLLVGIDLVKDVGVIEAAYNDSKGVTAAFNKNVLSRINSELGGMFDLGEFEHHAPFVQAFSRIEMHLVSKRRQVVPVCALDEAYAFEAGESIHTENSHKYTPAAFSGLAGAAGLRVSREWTDAKNWFSVVLLDPRHG
ncbi:MAG: L-histidine N(alpha)-methyltransferase [Fimbriimonadaceae bacterium]